MFRIGKWVRIVTAIITLIQGMSKARTILYRKRSTVMIRLLNKIMNP